ncbi:MAG: AI-2E family transporter [Gammaproteobacteria bacterium]|nr:AI-2E family transporter [Gammaproteobacteria bacterium]
MERIQKEKVGLITAVLVVVALYFLGPVLPPFLAGFIIAYLGDPLVSFLVKRGMSRTWAASLVFFVFLLLIVFTLILLLPLLESQLILFYKKIPDLLAWIQQTLLPWINNKLGVEEVLPFDYFKKIVTNNVQQTGSVVMSVWKTLSHSGLMIIESVFTCLLVPVVTFYLLRDWNSVWRSLLTFFPRSARGKIIKFVSECNEVLGAFLRGQLIVIIALGIIYSVGLWLAGLEFALLVGLFSGLINIVPYLGLIVGMSVASLMMFIQYHDGLHVLYALLVFLVGSGLDNTLLTPNLIGDRIGLHPVAVIFAILAGGHLFGFVGVLLALPAASIIMVFMRHLQAHFTHD